MLVTDIKWETDGEIVSLPTEVEVDDNMSDDEIKYMNHMWNAFFSDKPHTPDFNNNKPKNSWLERKTKRGR